VLTDCAYLKTADAGIGALRTDLDSPSTLVLIFSGLGIEHMQIPLIAVREAFPSSVLVGCSTSGEVFGPQPNDGGIAVAVARFDRTTLTYASAAVARAKESHEAGVQLAQALQSDSLAGVLVLSDGLHVDDSQLLEGMNLVLRDSVVVTGGLTGGPDQCSSTWVIAGGALGPGTVVAVGLHGDAVEIGHGSAAGWEVMGGQQLASRSEGDLGFESEGRRAPESYQEPIPVLADDRHVSRTLPAIAGSCVGRRPVPKQRGGAEFDATGRILVGRATMIGFYSYGEASSPPSGRGTLHSRTMTVTTLSEGA
jgi:hypothetical protein